jgi:hypothetical protein
MLLEDEVQMRRVVRCQGSRRADQISNLMDGQEAHGAAVGSLLWICEPADD